jgi:hypothetical protein
MYSTLSMIWKIIIVEHYCGKKMKHQCSQVFGSLHPHNIQALRSILGKEVTHCKVNLFKRLAHYIVTYACFKISIRSNNYARSAIDL